MFIIGELINQSPSFFSKGRVYEKNRYHFNFIITLLVLIYILVRPQPEIISVSLISETAETTYIDNDSIQIFSDAIRTVKKVRGAVDVGPPTYRMNVTYADSEVVKFSLYLDYKIKSGFLINHSNSEKMLKLKESSSKELTDLLSKD